MSAINKSSAPQRQRIQSLRFGEIELDSETVIRFQQPLYGLENSRRFALLELQEYEPFLWLQSLDEAAVCLALVDPWLFFQNYRPRFEHQDLEELQLEEDAEVAVYCVVAPGAEPSSLTANLAAPIVFHPLRRQARQLVLEGEYPLEAPLKEAAKCS